MKKLLTLATLTAFALALPATGFAAAKKKPADSTDAAAATPAPPAADAKKPADESTKHTPFYMKVDEIDDAAKTFTHKKKDGDVVKFVVTEKTTIKNGAADAKFSDIKAGDTVGGSGIVTKRGSDKKPTEYEVVKITKFGVVTPKGETPAAATPAADAKKKK